MTHLSTSVQELLAGAQRALRAVAPIADDLGVRWKESENYLDWDAIATGVFEGLVLAAIRSSIGWVDCLPLISYDKRVVDYSGFSYIAVERSGRHAPVICLETAGAPFDTCLIAEIGPDFMLKGQSRLPFAECRFVVVGRRPTGITSVMDTISW